MIRKDAIMMGVTVALMTMGVSHSFRSPTTSEEQQKIARGCRRSSARAAEIPTPLL